MGKNFWWFNRFNQVELDGPFSSAAAAKRAVAGTYSQIQGGMAFDIAVVTMKPERYQELVRDSIVGEGYVEGGKWVEGRREISQQQGFPQDKEL
jgi:hypothetical protein